jgi:hypothetical protein
VLGVDEGGDAAVLLRVADDVQTERRLTGRFRPEDPRFARAGHRRAQGESSESDPVGMPSALSRGVPSSFMTEPLPNCFSIC